jgi:hypothetical protein
MDIAIYYKQILTISQGGIRRCVQYAEYMCAVQSNGVKCDVLVTCQSLRVPIL